MENRSIEAGRSSLPPAESGRPTSPDLEPVGSERPTVFGSDRRLIGVLSLPGGEGPGGGVLGAIFLNSGLIHRIGPNRMWVRGARRLAGSGIASLRFDHSGVGDSPPARDARPLRERWVAEIRMSMDHMATESGVTGFLLVGNCSGALGAFLAALEDPRVKGVALVNPPPPRTPLRYFLRLTLSQPAFWRRVGGGLLRGTRPAGDPTAGNQGGSAPSDREIEEEFSGLLNRGVRILILHSEWDPGRDYYQGRLRRILEGSWPEEQLEFGVVGGVNHDFGLHAAQEDLLQRLGSWARIPSTVGIP